MNDHAHIPAMKESLTIPKYRHLPYLTGGIEGCGGRMRDQPEDFLVEELPQYLPSGQGEHLYLWIEKRNLSTTGAIHHLLKKLRLPPVAAGFAGRKDTRAVTRQWISLHTDQEPLSEDLECEGFRILEKSRHGNKLRKGHLEGNRFSIILRDINPNFDPAPVFDQLQTDGFPNYFGAQRMGINGDNPVRGRELIVSPKRRRIGGEKARFLINAYQSILFNDLVAARLSQMGNLTQMLTGDLAVLHRNRAVFKVTGEDLQETQARADHGELSASAPLLGFQVPLAEGEQGEWEIGILNREGITQATFSLGAKRHSPKGERRAVRILPNNLSWKFSGNQRSKENFCLHLNFTLPKGTYATSLLREVMRNDPLEILSVEQKVIGNNKDA